jgi:hypothetical protein
MILVASMPRISRPVSLLLGCWLQKPKTGLITTPNITQTRTMKPTEPLMWASKNRLAPTLSHPLFLPTTGPRVSLFRFSLFIFPFSNLLSIIFPTLRMLLQGCVDPLVPGHGQTIPRSVARTHQHHLNVAREPSWLS